MSNLYTWHDVERAFLFNKDEWPPAWNQVDVYSDEVLITLQSNETSEESSLKTIGKIFEHKFSPKDKVISLDFGGQKLKVNYENSDERVPEVTAPLFKEYSRNADAPVALQGAEVWAFHSYKGGVGRTLSLLATAQALSNNSQNKLRRLLIVDADIEAPGLTWLAKEVSVNSEISLIDAMELIHEQEDWRKDALPFIKKKIEETVLRMPVGGKEVEHFFLPAYREVSQLFTLPVVPEIMVQMNERGWVMGDFFSELGKALLVDIVLIDLRAGISELAAPILFDPRIKKIYVTSTSMQSTCGLHNVLERIYKKPIDNSFPNPTVFMSMVTEELSNLDLARIEQDLSKNITIYPEDADIDHMDHPPDIAFLQLPFNSDLIHLEGLKAIDKKIAPTEFFRRIQNWINESLPAEIPIEKRYSEEASKVFLEKLFDNAKNMEHAETSDARGFLAITPLRNIARRYSSEVPRLVIIGAKGSGKTFVFLQMLRAQTWENFIDQTQGTDSKNKCTWVIPFLHSKNFPVGVSADIKRSFDGVNETLGFSMQQKDLIVKSDAIEESLQKSKNEVEWKEFWRSQILNGTGCESFEDLQNKLISADMRVVFIADGLEEVFMTISSSSQEKTAVRALCQGIVNELKSISDGRIGIVVFARQDIIENAIEQNRSQFQAQYSAFELKWTIVEALRLALWITSLADKNFTEIQIENATSEILERALIPLWGLKLGKENSREAISANWILVALSDLNQQTQARDIVRFLKHSAEETLKGALPTDRYLAPAAIRKAIQPCSAQKIQEIEDEMEPLRAIFEKLQSKPEGERSIPFEIEEFGLSNSEGKQLEQHGYLKKLNDGYYLPEIIRHGLKFKISKGARPKVLALVRRNNE